MDLGINGRWRVSEDVLRNLREGKSRAELRLRHEMNPREKAGKKETNAAGREGGDGAS